MYSIEFFLSIFCSSYSDPEQIIITVNGIFSLSVFNDRNRSLIFAYVSYEFIIKNRLHFLTRI